MRAALVSGARVGAVLAALAVAPAVAAKPAALGAPVEREGVRVTLLACAPLGARELKGAPGGFKLVWLVEPSSRVPALGDVRLTVRGRRYNQVASAASSKPLAPDVVAHDYPTYAAANPVVLPEALGAPREGALVVEVLLRGARLPERVDGVGGLELGLWASSSKKPRFTWFRARTR